MLTHYVKSIVRLKKVREGTIAICGIAFFFKVKSMC